MTFRNKIYLAIGVGVFVIIAGILIWAIKTGRIRSTAETLNNESNYPVFVQLPKDLADKVKQPSRGTEELSSEDQKKVDDLINQKLKEKLPSDLPTRGDQSDQSQQKQFLDAVVVFTDEQNKPILPDLEKLKAAGTSRSVGIPETNKITFTISDDFSSAEKQKLQETIDKYYPKIQEIYGLPFFNTTARIQRGTLNGLFGAHYTPSRNQITFNKDFFPDITTDYFEPTLIHEIGHAWRDDLMIGDKVFEEGSAKFLSEFIFYGNLRDFYDYKNKPFVTRAFVEEFMTPYVYGSLTFNKIFIEDKEFFIKFNAKYYNLSVFGQAILFSREQAEKALFASVESVEGKPFRDWYNSQYIFNPSSKTGRMFATESPSFPALLEIKNSKLYWLGEKEIEFTLTDLKNQLLARGNCRTMLLGTINTEDCFDQVKDSTFQSYSGTVKITLRDIESNITETYFFPFKKISHGKNPLTPSAISNTYLADTRIIFTKYIPEGKLIIKDRLNQITGEISIKESKIDGYPDVFKQEAPSSFEFSYYCPEYGKEKGLVPLGIRNRSGGDADISVLEILSPSTSLTLNITEVKPMEWRISPSQAAAVKITVTNLGGKVIKTLKEKEYISSPLNISWDGKDNQNNIVPSGQYMLKIEGVNQYCARASTVKTFTFTQTTASDKDKQRKSDLESAQKALEAYHKANGHYPVSSGAAGADQYGIITSSGTPGSWIPELAPKYISQLPNDPVNTKWTGDWSTVLYYWYYGGGDNYKIGTANMESEEGKSWAADDGGCRSNQLEMFTEDMAWARHGPECDTLATSTNSAPTIATVNKSIKRYFQGLRLRYRLVASWQGSDKEDGNNLSYRYKIDKSDKWSPWSQQTSITINGLKGKNHTITVQAKDSKGLLSKEMTK